MLSHWLHHHHEETQVKPPPPYNGTGFLLTEMWFWSRSKFFCSSGSVKEVSEVNSMNESLQVELQVRSFLNPRQRGGASFSV